MRAELFLYMIYLSLINTAFYIMFIKWKINDLYDLYRRKWMPLRCNFCFFFWTSLLCYTIKFLPSLCLIDNIITSFFLAVGTSVLSLYWIKNLTI